MVASKQHPLAAADALQLSQLSDYRWVVYPKDMPMRQALERELNEAGLQVPRYPLETSSTFATILLVTIPPLIMFILPTLFVVILGPAACSINDSMIGGG